MTCRAMAEVGVTGLGTAPNVDERGDISCQM